MMKKMNLYLKVAETLVAVHTHTHITFNGRKNLKNLS